MEREVIYQAELLASAAAPLLAGATVYIEVGVPDGKFRALAAFPTDARAPVVIVLQEIFGINDDMKATCAELAARGFVAICPDLFWRMEPGLSLSHFSDEEWKKGLALYDKFDLDKGVEDIAATIAVGRRLTGGNGKVGVMGYCLGGLMTFLTAARTNVDAAVEFYGGETDTYASEGKNITGPMMIHLGEEDELISKAAQKVIKDSVAHNPNVKVFSYPGCSHAFARHYGANYNAGAAECANTRTWVFFHLHLSASKRSASPTGSDIQ